MRVSTTDYEFTHGRKPRGFGMWWFCISACHQETAPYVTMMTYTGHYSEAKAKAIKAAKQVMNCTGIRVGA